MSQEEQSQQKVIKKFETLQCPHCGKDIILGTHTIPPSIVSASTSSDIENAKQTILGRLEEDVEFASPEDKKAILKWIKDKDTMVDFGDVELLVKEISIDQTKKIQQRNKKSSNVEKTTEDKNTNK